MSLFSCLFFKRIQPQWNHVDSTWPAGAHCARSGAVEPAEWPDGRSPNPRGRRTLRWLRTGSWSAVPGASWSRPSTSQCLRVMLVPLGSKQMVRTAPPLQLRSTISRELAESSDEDFPSDEVEAGSPWSTASGTTSIAATAAVAKSVGEVRPPQITECTATQNVNVPREAVLVTAHRTLRCLSSATNASRRTHNGELS